MKGVVITFCLDPPPVLIYTFRHHFQAGPHYNLSRYTLQQFMIYNLQFIIFNLHLLTHYLEAVISPLMLYTIEVKTISSN